MLASAGPMPTSTVAWAFEPKLDGWRVLVYVDCTVAVQTRSGRSIGDSVPELEPLPEALAGRRVVLDGELVAGQGRSADFYRLGPRMSACRPVAVQRWHRAVPVTFAAFDLLFVDGDRLTGEPYEVRRELLESLHFSGHSWCTVASYRTDGVELLDSCGDLDLEGIVAKRVRAPYRPGSRSRDWIKLKTPGWREHHAPLRHEQPPSASRIREIRARRRSPAS